MCVCVCVFIQSPQCVPVVEGFAQQCQENLDLSPCKEIFSDCRK